MLLIALFNYSVVFADFSFSTSKTTLTPEEEIELNVELSLQGQGNKTYYLEGAFKKENSSNYFGLTWNDAEWIKYTTSSFITLKSITTDQAGKWSGVLKSKLDSGSNLYTGGGSYIFQLKRFTTSGSASWSDNSVTINVISNSTPSPSPTSPPLTPIPSSKTSTIFEISNVPPEVQTDQSFKSLINLSLPDSPSKVFFLKGTFKKPEGSNYFGLTKVDSSWINNGNSYSNQYKITIDSTGNWSGELEVQPDILDSGYDNSGEYIFKVARYSESGTGLTWSNELKINLKSSPISTTLSDQDSDAVNLTPLQSSEKATTLKTSLKTPLPELPEEVYSLENYLASRSSQIATVAGQTLTISNKNHQPINQLNNLMIASGIVLMLINLGWYLRAYLKKGKISPT